MEYVTLLRSQEGLSRKDRDGTLMRRLEWEYPQGVELIAEYWPQAHDPAVVSIVRTDDVAALMEINLTWGDVFDVRIFPAISAQQGLEVGPEALKRRNA